MKKIMMLVLVCALAGCAATPLKNPPVSGELVPINTQSVGVNL